MTFWTFVAIGLLGVVSLRWLAKRRIVYRGVPLPGLRRFVSSLLARADGGFFIADRESGPGFLQLALRQYRAGQCSVEFGLPDVDWSRNEFDAVVAALEKESFAPGVEPGEGSVSRFVRVLVAGPEARVIERSMSLLDLVARSLGWNEETTFRVRFGGSLALGRALERARSRGA
jgi:hypothetical protein